METYRDGQILDRRETPACEVPLPSVHPSQRLKHLLI